MFNGAWPAGAIDAAHVPLLLARALWLAMLLSATGALAFRALEGQTEAGRLPSVRKGLTRLIVASLAGACVAWAVWSVLQAAAIAGATGPAAAFAALKPVFSRTLFGHVALIQLGLLLVSAATLPLGWGVLRVLPALGALAATALQVQHLHAFAMQGWASVLTVAVVLHLWAAALWLGALLPLRLVLRAAPLPAARDAVRRFSARAMVLVAVLAATALYQGIELFGGVPGLFGSSYGWAAMSKAVLFAVLLAMAWHNRFRLTPALAGPDPAAGRAALTRNLLRGTGVGVAVVLAAAVLTALPPGMHGQPVWPFTLRPKLPLSHADLVWLAAPLSSVLLLGGALWRRRFRLPALVAAAVLLLVAAPRLGAMTEPATPTGFYRSPTGFTAASVADGAALFTRNCAGCHAGAPPKLRLAAADGDLFWQLSAGVPGMPGFAATLDEDARWHLIDALRARAAAGSLPVRAPDLELACADGSAPSLSDLRGKFLRIVFQPGGGEPGPAPPGVAVLTLPAPPPPVPDHVAEGCIVADPDLRAAYALATGLSADDLAGTELLIDRDGLLRAVLRPGTDAAARAAAFARLAAPPAG
jgi:putative copper export protein/mono/diheme cytochrome c family protein